MKAKGVFSVEKWNERHLENAGSGVALAGVSAEFIVTGDLDGRLLVEYVMHYAKKGSDDPHHSEATYSGFMVFEGEISGLKGSFVVADTGQYSEAGPQSSFVVKPGTGTEDFAGIVGKGTYVAQGQQMVIELEYSI